MSVGDETFAIQNQTMVMADRVEDLEIAEIVF